jgi:hypothetical protein
MTSGDTRTQLKMAKHLSRFKRASAAKLQEVKKTDEAIRGAEKNP